MAAGSRCRGGHGRRAIERFSCRPAASNQALLGNMRQIASIPSRDPETLSRILDEQFARLSKNLWFDAAGRQQNLSRALLPCPPRRLLPAATSRPQAHSAARLVGAGAPLPHPCRGSHRASMASGTSPVLGILGILGLHTTSTLSNTSCRKLQDFSNEEEEEEENP